MFNGSLLRHPRVRGLPLEGGNMHAHDIPVFPEAS